MAQALARQMKPEAEAMLAEADALALSRDQKERLNFAAVLEGGTWAQRSEAKQMIAAVRAELAVGLAETRDLEQARNADIDRADRRAVEVQTVERGDNRGQLRIRGRDGLVSLYDTGGLTGRAGSEFRGPDDWSRAALRLQAGLAFRDLYEPDSGALRSALGGDGTSINRHHRDYAAQAFNRARDGRDRDRLERMTALLGRRELTILRKIAGEGVCLHTLAKPGNSRAVHLKALIRALDVVAAALRLPGYPLLTGGTG